MVFNEFGGNFTAGGKFGFEIGLRTLQLLAVSSALWYIAIDYLRGEQATLPIRDAN